MSLALSSCDDSDPEIRHICPGMDQRMIRFLKALKRNNRREWFDAHRKEYEQAVKLPARQWVAELRPLLIKLSPHLEISPRSIYRINRDTRFSDDKTPYKTWVGFSFWDRRFKKDQAPGYYFGIDPTGFALGAGIYRFEPLQRAVFRERLVEEFSGQSFASAIKPLKRARFELKGRELKKIPQGYDPWHPLADYLRHNGLYASKEFDFPSSFGTAKFTRDVVRCLEPCAPLMAWLSEHLRMRDS
ncbi:DUF2461 domain-containing protein [bacterium]|nr:DUF2461 domain-containing protein [bacterium]